jgi:hypothetical protein
MTKIKVVAAIWLAVLLCGITLAQDPVINVNKQQNPNLWQAQQSIIEATHAIVAAQKANNYDMQDHAEKAKKLLLEADKEIKLAAVAANNVNAEKAKRKGKQ